MRLRDVWLKDNLKFQTSSDTTLPVVLQFIQGAVTSKSKFTSGTIGNLNYAFAIELPEMESYNKKLCPGFSMISKIMETYKVLKFSRDELLEKFYIIEIPDFSNQALTPGFLDFIPFVFIGKDKIYQNHIGMIRSYYSKQAYILIDKQAKFINNNLMKPIYEDLNTLVTKSNPISVLIKFKRYYDKGTSVSMPYKGNENPNQKNVYEIKMNKAVHRNNEYKVNFKILTSSLSESDFNHISFYKVKNNIKDYDPSRGIENYNKELKEEVIKNGIKLNNSFILKNIKIEIKQDYSEKNIIVNRQSTPSRDYYQILMAMLYNRYNSNDNDSSVVYQEFIDFSVSFDDYLKDGSNVIGVLDNNESQMLCYSNNSNNLKISNLDIDNADQLVVVKYNYNDLSSTSFFYSAGEDKFNFTKNSLIVPDDSSASYYEIIPLLYDDENYAFKVNSDITSINIPSILKANKVYKYNLDLDYSTIFAYNVNHKFIHLTKNSNEGTLSYANSLKDSTIILTASKEHTKIFENLPAPESISSLGKTNYNFDYTILEDPYLELIDDVTNDHSKDFNIPSSEAKLKDQPFLYDCTKNGYSELENILIDNEPRITEDEDGYYISTQTLKNKSEYTNYKKYTSNLKDKYNTMYHDVIETHLINTQDKYLNKQFDAIRKTFIDVYFNCSSIENTSNIFKYTEGSFLCLALELNEPEYFDLVISSENKVKYKEFNCIPIEKNNHYVYIHIPYYNFNKNELGIQDDITQYSIEFIPKNNSTKVIKYSFIK